MTTSSYEIELFTKDLPYLTGWILVKTFTLGSIKIAPLSTYDRKLKPMKKRGKNRSTENGLWIKYGPRDQHHLHAANVAGIGLVFWICAILIAAAVFMT